MNPRRKSRLFFIVSILIGLAIASGLVLYALRQNIDLFYTPSEIIYGKDHNPSEKPNVGQHIRVGGMVVKGSVIRDPNTLKVTFKLNDIGPSITVHYEGILPDLFREGQGIVAQGTLVAPTVLDATQVLAKHDSKYVPPDLEKQMEKVHKNYGVSSSELQANPQDVK
ncbi:cytochrome c maturation protein CcmE [Actinobacillus delphinicola]|uniref:Cytochrome c-type biogenesis protein CcmE n=1 Tax=Actinobacillus delphinicola TaxID=51161 RepID=A0A448TUE2_9PAST|nr:cytochrome c maturation protein CcmE [Actinobacillus delphinicola]VEJ09620.1 cytochrome c-type biogenesis protein CcmE [Actinobacillus delphinicola]